MTVTLIATPTVASIPARPATGRMTSIGGETAFGQDHRQRQRAEDLRQVRVLEPKPSPASPRASPMAR